jgi:hypothetical protein
MHTMRNKLGSWGLALGVVLFVAGCGSRPTPAIDSAKAALDKASAAGASEYAPSSLKEAQDAQAALDAELKAQDGQLLKSYGRATDLAAAAQKAAEKAAADADAGKAKAKSSATAAIAEAKKDLAGAQALLAKAPKAKGKASVAHTEAMKGNLTKAANAIADAGTALTSERFVEARTKAESAAKAATEVKTAMAAKTKAGSKTGSAKEAAQPSSRRTVRRTSPPKRKTSSR